MINDIKKDMIEQLSYFIEINPKGYMLYDDVQEMVDGVLEKYESFNNIGYFEACKQLQAYKDKEDKLREILKKHTPANEDIILYEIKQILNKGSDK